VRRSIGNVSTVPIRDGLRISVEHPRLRESLADALGIVPELVRHHAAALPPLPLLSAILRFRCLLITYLEEDGIWQGYVRLKDFDWQQLLP